MRAAIVIALVLASRVAGADDRVAAERFYRGGEKAYRAQNFAAAAANFEQAYKALALPEIAFSAAQAYRRQYRIDGNAAHVSRAIVLYRAYLDKVTTGGRVADAADALGEMQHELEKLIKSGAKVSPELAAEHTQLGVNVVFADAAHPTGSLREIEDAPAANTPPVHNTIDGKDVPPVTPINLAPGSHAIHVEADGYVTADRTELVAQGAFQMPDVVLTPKPAIVSVTSESGARISIDGRPAGIAPTRLEVAAGKHLIAILHDGREPFARELFVARGESTSIDQPLVETARRRAVSKIVTIGCITAGLAALSTIAAVIEDTRASSLHDRIASGDQPPSVGADYNSELSWRNGFVDGIWAFGGLTAALGVTSALLYYTDKPSLEGVHVEPLASPSGGGAALSGAF